jgi:hypothetical protein
MPGPTGARIGFLAIPEHTISVRQPAKKAWRNGIDDESIIVAIRIGDY